MPWRSANENVMVPERGFSTAPPAQVCLRPRERRTVTVPGWPRSVASCKIWPSRRGNNVLLTPSKNWPASITTAWTSDFAVPHRWHEQDIQPCSRANACTWAQRSRRMRGASRRRQASRL
eukprot:14478423-Alexandrium_andersonii.AAC.1